MIAFFVAAVLHQEAHKDVHVAATTLDRAVEQVSHVFGASMDVSNLIKGKVILIDARDVTLRDLMSQIAKTANATWEDRSGVAHLMKTAKQQREDDAFQERFRLKFLNKTFKLRAETENSHAAYSRSFAVQIFNQLRSESRGKRNGEQNPGPTAAGYGLPNQRFMTAFLLKFGVDRIAAVKNGERAVFAIHPNAMQQPLGIDIGPEVDKLMSEQSLWRKTADELSKDQESNAKTPVSGLDARAVAIAEYQGSESTYRNSPSNFPTNLANVLFSVYCGAEGTYTMEVTAIPATRDELAFQVAANSIEGAFAGLNIEDFQKRNDPDFKLSERASDFRSFMFDSSANIPVARLQSDLNEFADPVNHDPLSYGLTDAYCYEAKRLNRNIVALVDDSSIGTSEPVFGDLFLNKRLVDTFSDIFTVDDKWIRIMNFPGAEPNIPRLELRNIIKRVRANHEVELDDQAALAALRPRGRGTSSIDQMLDRFAGISHGYSDVDALKCLGLMDSSERSAATSRQGIRYGMLNPALQRHLFECCFYNSYCRIYSSAPKNGNSYLSREATLIAPRGISPDSIFQVKVTQEAQIKAPDGPGSFGLQTTARGWGNTKYQLDHPEEYVGVDFKFDQTKKLRRVNTTSYTFRLDIQADVSWSTQIQSVSPTSDAEFTINSFPADLKAEFDAGYADSAQAAKKRLDRKKGDGGGYFQQK